MDTQEKVLFEEPENAPATPQIPRQGALFPTSRSQSLLARTPLASRARARCLGTGSDCACKFPRSLQGKLRPASPRDTARAVKPGRLTQVRGVQLSREALSRLEATRPMKGGCGPPRLTGLAGESAASLVPDRPCAQWEPLPSRFRAASTFGLAMLGRAAGARPLLPERSRGRP